ncbi:MAG: M48 family metallopeptidase [Deltaproteobacteria bacterium]|nr:M48 family metallopeptidase [Deltaproteobacteria bacterium]
MIQCNYLLISFIVVFLTSSFFRWLLTKMNINHQKTFGHTVPPVFQDEIDGDTLSRITDYSIESSRFQSLARVVDDIILLVILLSGILPWFAETILSFDLNFVLSGLLFFAGPALVGFIVEVPFSLYGTFVIEKKYGFSTISPSLWLQDIIKNVAISVVIGGILLGSFLALMKGAATTWWFWGWLLFAAFQLLVLWLYPLIIAPLFNRYEPVRDDELKERIVNTMGKAGLKIKGVYQMDAGTRSRHTNAYFTGIGATKRIVLYDTLLASHTSDEVLSVLAHEIGHWKKKHILKQLVIIEMFSLFLFYGTYLLIDWPVMYRTFGVDQNIPYVGIFILSALFKPVSFFFTPLMSGISRAFEVEADRYSRRLMGSTRSLVNALKRLAKDNLANLHPHPLYVWFYYSHPPLVSRIAELRKMDGDGKEAY